MKNHLTNADVWTFLEAGCNVEEIATYAGVSRATARAMVARAIRAVRGAA